MPERNDPTFQIHDEMTHANRRKSVFKKVKLSGKRKCYFFVTKTMIPTIVTLRWQNKRKKCSFIHSARFKKCILILMSYSENGILNWPWKKSVSFVFILRLREFAIFVPCQKFRWRKISLSKNKWGCAKQFFTYVFVYIRK